jgi:hypothetical protein
MKTEQPLKSKTEVQMVLNSKIKGKIGTITGEA